MYPADPHAEHDRQVSVVVPVFNEAESLTTLAAEINAAAMSAGAQYEIIFVNDGSTDGSSETLSAIAERAPHVRVIEFRRNFGKAAALDAGFRAAAGDVVITMDADLQDDAAEIPRFLEKLDEGFDVVSGWKARRLDPVDKTAPSKVFNWAVSRFSGVKLNDFNCGFKAYRREAIADLHLYGELHRFIPVLLHWRGFKVGEIPVNHRPRQYGQSKFGAERLFKGALDFLSVILNTRFATRPLHIFGGVGAVIGAVGVAILLYLTAAKIFGGAAIGARPLFFLGILLTLTALQFFTIGLLGEFIQRQASAGRPAYTVRRTLNMATLDALEPEILKLRKAAQLLKEMEPAWTPQQQSAPTPAPGTGENTRAPTRSSA